MKESLMRMTEVTENVNFAEFSNNWVLISAVRDQVMILGGAAKSIPEDVRIRYPVVPWSLLARTRDRLIHGYFKTDPRLLYSMATIRARELLPEVTMIESELASDI